MKAATQKQINAIQSIYNYFNANLFEGKLNDCLLNFSRKSKAYGFFAPERWSERTGQSVLHEISLNPEYLKREPKEVVSTLVHEMVHLWQQDHDKPANGYHCKRFAKKMKEIGLHPSNTGMPGGKETGKNMSHYIIEGGAFDLLFNEMPKDFIYPLVCVQEMTGSKKSAAKNKTKYTCECGTNIWGKPGLIVQCTECDTLFCEA